ncbi:hypothetical protein CMQ_7712 [Grosmannia clavigera kw1407]|uniref:Ubiquitin-like domain-containing protein n=1 Tax=Grosmannia clavigera (strain kw1407 / UAMH 11150) TaxID=655863 RepID=F0XPF1_GROCL|nr:uncharacterized protein CMQ_7712 [Grosmannia clavigera kw1407]EFX00710.1 hypothetical protein CMQ_7712 [Grosmannia clavigera kw1407]
MSATPAKKKPLIFKRRAGPVSAPSTAALDSDSDSDSGSNPSAVPRPAKSQSTPADRTDNGGVDLFRRARQFFPRAIEEQNQRLLAEKQRKQQSPAGATDRTPASTPDSEDHDIKRRKVSYETANSDYDDNHGRQQKASPNKLGSKATATPSPKTSPSQRSPQSRSRDKGKGIATPHTVNSRVIFANESSTRQPDTKAEAVDVAETADDSAVLLDSPGSSGERAVIEAAIAQIKAEECREPLAVPDIREDPPKAIVFEVEDDKSEDEGEGEDDSTETANPEFNEYIMRAHARAAAAQTAQAVREAAGSVGASRGTSTTATTSSTGTSQPFAGPSPGSTPASSGTLAASDQAYRILITPNLPEPVPPLAAMLRMDQMMRCLPKAFLDHARKNGLQLSEEDEAGIVLTWKGMKMYSWTTGHLLGVRPDAHGKFHDDLGRSSGFQSGGLHLEIWTEDLYEAFLKDQERRRLRKLGEAVDLDLDSSSENDDDGAAGLGGSSGHGHEAGGSAATEAAAASSRQRIRLVLKSRDHEKLNMTVYADTKVETLIAAFREQRKIAPEQTIAIHWDGERLEEDMTVQDAEMEDMDSVEVFIH